MLSEDRNVKWNTVGISHGLGLCVSACVSMCVCVYSCTLARDRCASADRTIPVIAQPFFYCCLMLGQSDRREQPPITPNPDTKSMTTKYKKKNCPKTRKQQHKEQQCIFGGRSYFSRHVSVIIIPGVAHV